MTYKMDTRRPITRKHVYCNICLVFTWNTTPLEEEKKTRTFIIQSSGWKRWQKTEYVCQQNV